MVKLEIYLLLSLPLHGLPIYVNLLCHPSPPSLLSLRPSQIAKDHNTHTWSTNSLGVPYVSKEHQEVEVL